MNVQPVIGISGCLTGSNVRFDGGHKRMGFVMDELAQWVTFKPICPEMAIGLPVRVRRCAWCRRRQGTSGCALDMRRMRM